MRKGHAGWFLPAPGAQCLGKYTFSYSLIPHAGSWQKAKIWQEAHNFETPLRVIQTGMHRGKLPQELSFIQVKPENLVISGIKRAEDNNKLVVRLYNSSGEHLEGRLSSFFPLVKAQVLKLDEQFVKELPVNNQSRISFKVKPWQIVTLGLFG